MATIPTWRNINAPSFTGVSDILSTAGQDFNRGIGDMERMLKSAQQTHATNRQNEVGRNDDAFLAQIQKQYGQDPLALEAAQQSGAIEAMRGQYGVGNLTADKTNFEAITGLGKQFKQDQVQAQQYTDFTNSQFNEGILNQIATERGLDNSSQDVLLNLTNQLKGSTGKVTAANAADLRGDTAYAQKLKNQANADADRALRLGDERILREDRAKEKKRKEFVDTTTMSSFKDLREKQAAYQSSVAGIKSNAKANGIGHLINDPTLLENASPEQVDAYDAMMQQIREVPRVDMHAEKQKVIDTLLNGGAGAEATNAASNLMDMEATASALPKQEREKFTRAHTANNTEFADNALVKDKINGVTPDTVIQEVSKFISPQITDLNSAQVSEMYNFIQSAMTKGLDIGADVGLKVPSSVILTAARSMSETDGWFDADRDDLKALVTQAMDNDNARNNTKGLAKWLSTSAQLNLEAAGRTDPAQYFIGQVMGTDIQGVRASVEMRKRAAENEAAREARDADTRGRLDRMRAAAKISGNKLPADADDEGYEILR